METIILPIFCLLAQVAVIAALGDLEATRHLSLTAGVVFIVWILGTAIALFPIRGSRYNPISLNRSMKLIAFPTQSNETLNAIRRPLHLQSLICVYALSCWPAILAEPGLATMIFTGAQFGTGLLVYIMMPRAPLQTIGRIEPDSSRRDSHAQAA
jgi:hypothetical protein